METIYEPFFLFFFLLHFIEKYHLPEISIRVFYT